MLGVVCTAGDDKRMGDLLKTTGVPTKSFLPVGGSPVILKTIREIRKNGAKKIVVVSSRRSVNMLKQQFKSMPNVNVVVQIEGPYGTASAVQTAILFAEGHGYKKLLLSWGDMLFRLPASKMSGNVIYTCGVSQSNSARFDGVVCSGNRALAISSRNVQKQGPFLMTTGVFLLEDLVTYSELYKEKVKNYTCKELPFEVILQEMMNKGVPVYADCLDFFIDLGTKEQYAANVDILLR